MTFIQPPGFHQAVFLFLPVFHYNQTMPAVDLTRLKKQIDGLVWRFTRPQEFVQEMHNIFSFYADRVYRPGNLMPQQSGIPEYHIPPLVLRQMEMELRKRCEENPDAAFNLVDLLWVDEMRESRFLAATLLGMVPLSRHKEVSDRMIAWSSHVLDANLMQTMLEKGSARIRNERSELWIEILKEWAANQEKAGQRLLLFALQALLQDSSFDNLPPIFDMITIPLKTYPQVLKKELLAVFSLLKNRSPAECAYFIRQTVRLGVSDNTRRLLRNIIAIFDEPTRSSLVNRIAG